MTTPWIYTSQLTFPPRAENLIVYAAAFIDPNIQDVRVENGNLVVECRSEVSSEKIERGLTRLCTRFAKAELIQVEAMFSLNRHNGEASQHGVGSDELFQTISPGLMVIKAPHGSLLRFLDWAVMRWFATPFSAQEEVYPNVIPLDTLARTQHLASFPEHLHFVSHLREDLDIIEAYGKNAKEPFHSTSPTDQELSAAKLVHNPSTCYHCYAVRDGDRLDVDQAITAVAKCHRFEATNHSDPGRLMEFTLREVIFLGSGDYVRKTREECLRQVEAWATAWQLFGELVPASDPFFTDDFEAKALHQHRLAMKYEYRAELSQSGRDLAILSSNLHGPTFGKVFNIKIGDRVANTGCFGVGLERLALTIVEQHGLDPDLWPAGLRQDHELWRSQTLVSFTR